MVLDAHIRQFTERGTSVKPSADRRIAIELVALTRRSVASIKRAVEQVQGRKIAADEDDRIVFTII
jgi:hypothetical protein